MKRLLMISLLGALTLLCGPLVVQAQDCVDGTAHSQGVGTRPPRAGLPGGGLRQPVSQEQAAVVRVVNRLAGSVHLGSGSLIDKNSRHGMILTCWHILSGGEGQITVVFPSGEAFLAKVMRTDETADLAVLKIRLPSATPIRLAQRDVRRGDLITMAGYGPDGRFRRQEGRAMQVVSFDAGATWDALEWTGRARQGDSGGPAWSKSGEQVAVISVARPGATAGTCCGKIRQFLSGLSPQFDSQPSAGAGNSIADVRRRGTDERERAMERGRQPADLHATLAKQSRDIAALVANVKHLGDGFRSSSRPVCQQCRPSPLNRPAGVAVPGPRGAQGRQGDRGVRGEKGPAGPPGKDGQDGISPDPAEVASRVIERLRQEDSLGSPQGPERESLMEEINKLHARLTALEAVYGGHARYRLRRVPVAKTKESD